MPAALGLEVRQEIVDRHKNGESFQTIAEEMGRSYDTVRGIWWHWQRHGTLKPNYEACRQTGPRKGREIYNEAIEMKRLHPRWGAQVIRLKLQDQHEEVEMPSVRTLQSWFRKAGVNRTAPEKQKQSKVKRGQEVHEVWAVDAKERMKLEDGSQASWLTITDEASGAILEGVAFPPEELVASSSDRSEDNLSGAIREVGKTQNDAL